MKNYSNKGITLVSLVVTIIVLIILAGVSINLMLGEKGIITIAKQAKENTELAKVEEETKLNELYMQIEAEGINSGDTSYDVIAKLVEFKREIASAITDMGIATAENDDANTMASNIRRITGASSADKISYDNTNSGLTATNVQSAIDEVENSLGEFGSCDLLSSSTSTSTSNIITLDERISDYKFVRLALNNGSEEYGSNMIPISLLKTSSDKFCVRAYVNGAHNAEVKYISDTSLLLRVGTSGDTAILYGIK